jgi:hypothetical protein
MPFFRRRYSGSTSKRHPRIRQLGSGEQKKSGSGYLKNLAFLNIMIILGHLMKRNAYVQSLAWPKI